MPIDLSCPSCGKASQAPDSAAGKRARCKSCGATLAIPEPPGSFVLPVVLDEEDRPFEAPPPRPADPGQAPGNGAAVPTVVASAPSRQVTELPSIPESQKYEYKMVQVPPNIEVMASDHRGSEAATYLETLVNRYARQGWEFHRVDTIGVLVRPGCLAAFFLASTQKRTYYVVTFRRPVVR